MNLIEVENLTYSYDGTNDVLKGVSFQIEKGSYTTIVGHNGSGKSTIAKLLIGLMEAKAGTITVDGIKLDEKMKFEIKSELYFKIRIISSSAQQSLTILPSDWKIIRLSRKRCRASLRNMLNVSICLSI